jgi:SHS2 domain-containing protein
MQAQAGWEHFEHGADIGVRGFGGSRVEAFAQAGRALTAVITDLNKVAARDAVPISCTAPDDELLLCDWLNALIYEMATRHMLFSRFELTITGQQLSAVAWGEPLDMTRHHPAVEIKGATYTALNVGRDAQGRWSAQCVVDV